ncbi:MAG TPA: regulator of cell autolysis [Dysgonomonas sp.]|nr:regulator of cell autolysis [Dysgonomonas sp.]
MINRELHNPLYSFLMESKFRWLRHIVLIVSVGIILANHLYITYKGQTENIGIHWIMLLYIMVFLTVIYLNIYMFIPRLLLKGKYIEYALILLGTVLILSLGDIWAEYHIHKYYSIPFGEYSFYHPERYPAVDFFSAFFIFMLYLFSVTVIVFYKHWIIDIQKVERLKTDQLHSELDSLKSRINTEFLLDKLHKAAGYSKTNPLNASRILLQLSRVLRYQLYDCSRENVLLSSEIKFFNDYLNLEKICNSNLDFSIQHSQTIKNCFIPPLLLISVVVESLKILSDQEGVILINIEFGITDNTLFFIYTDNRKEHEVPKYVDSQMAISKRLGLLQNQNYSLKVLPDKVNSQYKLIFQYELQEV